MEKIKSYYREKNIGGKFKTENYNRIIQIYGEGGTVKIGESTYPIYDGFLYFIGDNTNYFIEGESLEISEIAISTDYLKEISKLLEFKKEYEKLFTSKNGLFFKVINNKTVDNRFKVVSNLLKKEKEFHIPLAMSKIIEIMNYGLQK